MEKGILNEMKMYSDVKLLVDSENAKFFLGRCERNRRKSRKTSFFDRRVKKVHKLHQDVDGFRISIKFGSRKVSFELRFHIHVFRYDTFYSQSCHE